MGNVAGSPKKILFTAEKKLIQELINNNCVVVFSKTQCIYCRKVKKLLNDSKISYEVVELDKRDDGSNLQEALLEITGAKTIMMLYKYIIGKIQLEVSLKDEFSIFRVKDDNLRGEIKLLSSECVPRVFINGDCIGGASESEQLHKQNKLLEKVHECSKRG